MPRPEEKPMKYAYEIYDGDKWLNVLGYIFDTPEEAKKAGVMAGFEYVRVVESR